MALGRAQQGGPNGCPKGRQWHQMGTQRAQMGPQSGPGDPEGLGTPMASALGAPREALGGVPCPPGGGGVLGSLSLFVPGMIETG